MWVPVPLPVMMCVRVSIGPGNDVYAGVGTCPVNDVCVPV